MYTVLTQEEIPEEDRKQKNLNFPFLKIVLTSLASFSLKIFLKKKVFLVQIGFDRNVMGFLISLMSFKAYLIF